MGEAFKHVINGIQIPDLEGGAREVKHVKVKEKTQT